MERKYVKEIYSAPEGFAGKEAVLAGWVRSVRDSKVFGFMDLNDGSCLKGIQVVFEAGVIDIMKR